MNLTSLLEAQTTNSCNFGREAWMFDVGNKLFGLFASPGHENFSLAVAHDRRLDGARKRGDCRSSGLAIVGDVLWAEIDFRGEYQTRRLHAENSQVLPSHSDTVARDMGKAAVF
jgi:hypothetical protein